MPTVRIWTLESDHDAEAAKCLANKLRRHLQLGNLSIQSAGKKARQAVGKKAAQLARRNALPRRERRAIPLIDALRIAVQDYLRQDDCIIFVIDTDGPMSSHQRRQEQNSFINQVEQILNDRRFQGKVFLVQAVQEIEAWLLVDCLGIFCYFASERAQYRENCRDKASTNQSFARLVRRYQRGNTENIVEAEMGGKGAKEYLEEFSEKILLALNPSMPQRNVREKRYNPTMSPEVAEHVDINQETLRRNNSLRKLGSVLARFNQS